MQRIAITARLNGSTLQFDEPAYERLAAYLEEASRTLDGNPDQSEILSDLEQAIADRCSGRLRVGQAVVSLAELQPALDEIGTVQEPDPSARAADAGSADTGRPLQQVSEGAWISGVCMGLARYFQLDVALLRVTAVLLLLVSGGSMILVYVVLMLLLPYAPLDPGRGSVRKLPTKCRELVEFLRGKLSTATD